MLLLPLLLLLLILFLFLFCCCFRRQQFWFHFRLVSSGSRNNNKLNNFTTTITTNGNSCTRQLAKTVGITTTATTACQRQLLAKYTHLHKSLNTFATSLSKKKNKNRIRICTLITLRKKTHPISACLCAVSLSPSLSPSHFRCTFMS